MCLYWIVVILYLCSADSDTVPQRSRYHSPKQTKSQRWLFYYCQVLIKGQFKSNTLINCVHDNWHLGMQALRIGSVIILRIAFKTWIRCSSKYFRSSIVLLYFSSWPKINSIINFVLLKPTKLKFAVGTLSLSVF